MNDCTRHSNTLYINRIVGFFCWILLQVALITTTGSSSDAYFCTIQNRLVNPTIIEKSNLDDMTKASYWMVISGNHEICKRSKISIGVQFIDPDRHVFGNYLPVIEIVTQKSYRYMPSEFSIDDLFYANLKLERLFKEYEGLRERSQSILEGLNVPYLYGSTNFGNLIKKRNDGLNQSINRVTNQTISLAPPVSG